MKIRAIIVDDEPLAQNIIKQYSLKIPFLEIIGACNDAICANQFLNENEVDLIFLDINMPKLSGIAFLRNLRNAPLIIFTTAYSEYALEGFELDAIDYLKKPFSFERFSKSVFKAEELLRLKENSKLEKTLENAADYLFVKSNKKTIKVNFSDIYFIEGLGDYIKLHLNNQKIVTNLSMKKILSLLPKKEFYRIHKSFIISLNKIEQLEGNTVSLNKVKVPIGNSYRQEFFKYIQSNLAD